VLDNQGEATEEVFTHRRAISAAAFHVFFAGDGLRRILGKGLLHVAYVRHYR
jgi:hypothetical protein